MTLVASITLGLCMKLIVGLGNPGASYERTRHNAGAMVIDALASKLAPGQPWRARFVADTVEVKIGEHRCVLAKPTTYMNRSGQSVAAVVGFYKLDVAKDLLVVVDELYLDVGVIRLRPGGSAGGHNGLADIERVLGTENYPRLRVGVGPKPAGADQAGFVLDRFTQEQHAALTPALEKAAQAAECFAADGLEAAMNKFNAKDKA